MIDERHVLTAAHCFQKPIDLARHQILVGLHDINKPVYNEQVFSAERIILHEQYDTNTNENDIAIIRLSKPVTFSDKINAICLPGPEALKANETVWVGMYMGFYLISNSILYLGFPFQSAGEQLHSKVQSVQF